MRLQKHSLSHCSGDPQIMFGSFLPDEIQCGWEGGGRREKESAFGDCFCICILVSTTAPERENPSSPHSPTSLSFSVEFLSVSYRGKVFAKMYWKNICFS